MAVQTLGHLGTAKSVPHLIQLLGNPPWDTRREAWLGLHRITAQNFPADNKTPWLEWWQTTSDAVREQALLQAAGGINQPTNRTVVPRPEALRGQLLGVDQVAGYYAARALGKLAGPENVQALAALLPEQTNGFWELSDGTIGRLNDAWENGRRFSVPAPDGVLKNLTQLTEGEVQGPEISFDGTKILFAMRRNKHVDGFHIFEIGTDGSEGPPPAWPWLTWPSLLWTAKCRSFPKWSTWPEAKRSTFINRPLALDDPSFPAVRRRGDLIYFGQHQRPYNRVYRD
jgi:hypothetical protein